MERTHLAIQSAPFDPGAEYARLVAYNTDDGAIVFFIGRMRDLNDDAQVVRMDLEHFPGMTEKVLAKRIAAARQRWPIHRITLIHRIGRFKPGDPIVLVGVSSPHRDAAFDASRYLMDFLKTEAPFWKKEWLADGSTRWVEARHSDDEALQRWDDTP